MKTRSSSGVGQKIDLEFDVDTLRITDEGAEVDEGYRPKSSSILDDLKRKNTEEVDEQPAAKVKVETDSTKLRQFINNIGELD